MRKIREILRLRFDCKCSHEMIAKSIGVGSTTVGECLTRFQDAHLTWPLPEGFTDEQLETALYPSTLKTKGDLEDPQRQVDWSYVHQELKRKHVTLVLLWNEHRQQHPQGLGYSQFCHRYTQWKAHLDVWMHQPHKGGEKLFVDYAGHTMPIVIDNRTGEVKDAQIFVATLGASNFTYTEATWTQTLPDWIKSHVNAFEFFQGCPEIVVPDNLKSGVQKAHRYEPDLNPTYQDMATHYGVAICPARSRAPKDKAKVENGVQQVERQILAKLRNRTFFSLHELNQALKPLLADLNERPFQKLPGSRLSQFQQVDKPALKPLPLTRYEYAEWKRVKVGFNYHIEVDKHFYSVPYTFVKRELYVRYDTKIIEIFDHGKRIASHMRNYRPHAYTTDLLHMPKAHQKQAEWTPERITSWAKKTGESTAKLTKVIMESRAHPQQGFRSCVGILRLGKTYGESRLEAACKRALDIGAHNYQSVDSILKNKLDQQPLPSSPQGKTPDSHEYIRGKHYFA